MTSSTLLVFSTSRAQSYLWPHSAYSRGYLVIILLDWSLTATRILTYFSTECRYLSSALRSCGLRKKLMQSAQERQSFEPGLIGPYISLVLPTLFGQIQNRLFDLDVEYQRIADTLEQKAA